MKLNTKTYPLAIVLTGLVYYLTGELGLLIQQYPGIAPIWPPSGLAVAALLIFGTRIWPGIALGVVILAYMADTPFLTTTIVTVGNTLEPVLAVLFLKMLVNTEKLFEQVKSVFTYFGVAVIIAPMISATLGTLGFCFGGMQPWSDFNGIWLTWWLGNATGNLVIAPLILIWRERPRVSSNRLRVAEAILLYCSLAAVSWSIFEIRYVDNNINLPLTYLPLPIALWIAIRLSLHGASLANMMVALITVLGSFRAMDLFAGSAISKILLLEVTFIGLTASTSLIAAAAFHERRSSENTLRNIVEGTAAFTGTDFFRSLVKHLAATLQVKYGFICELHPTADERVQTLAFWANDRFLPNFTYDTKDTPCAEVVAGSTRYYPAHLQALFPRMPLLKKLNANSYLGVPLVNSGAKVIGHLVIMNDLHLSSEKSLRTLMSIFAARASAELEREQTEKELREHEAQMTAIVNTAAEGIITIAPSGQVESFNPAAEKIFGYAANDVLGENFTALVSQPNHDGTSRDLAVFLENTSELPGLSSREIFGRRKNGSMFPIHLSTSQMKLKGEMHYTCIVQDITERKQAQRALFSRMKISEFGEEIGLALMHGNELRQTLQQCAQAIVNHLGAVLARIWTLDDTGSVLHLQASAGLYTHTDDEQGRIPVGPRYKIGQIAQERAPYFTNAAAEDSRIHDTAWITEQNIVGFAGHPLLVEGQLVGVMGLFARHKLDDLTIEALSGASSSIAQTISRTKAKVALHQSEARYRFLVENAPVGILTTNTQGELLEVNQAILDLLGSPSKEYTRRINLLTFPPLIAAGISGDFKKCLSTGELVVSERPYTSQTGKFAYLRLNLVPTRNGGGQVTGVQAIVENILDRKKAEEKIIANEKYYRTLIEKMYEGIAIIQFDGTIVYESPSVERIVGYEPQDLVGQNILDYIHPHDRNEVRHRLKDARHLRHSQPETAVFRFKHKTGGYRLLESTSTVQAEGSLINGIVANYRDITEKAQADKKLKASLQEKETLLKEIHHRVKNNLQVISSLLKLQAKTTKDTNALGILTESHNRVKAMALVHENLYQSQDLARINFQKYIQDLSRQLTRSYASTGKQISIKTDIQPLFLDIDLAIPCGLIITELVSNSFLHAFQEMQNGEISVALGGNGNGRLQLHVADNGSGLPDGFDINATDSLGLQLVGELVQQISGELEIGGQRGSEFRVTFSAK